MSKIRLIPTPEIHTIFRSQYLDSIWKDYFLIEEDTGQSADNRTVYIGPPYESNWIKDKRNAGYKVALDATWEYSSNSSIYTINSKNWFWYNESLWYTDLGYNEYIPTPDFIHTAFMPINKQRPWRTNLVTALGSRLNSFLWSYGDQTLTGDIDKDDILWQRYFNPLWYNSTEFSFVVESNLVNKGFVTEKTFKALAFSHPFIVYGPPGVLELLHCNGFETFDEIFNESYDTDISSNNRLTKLLANVDNYTARTLITEQKLKHNRNHFFNLDLVKRKITEEIIVPLIEYAESQ
jgi:hypothetical protein